MLLKKNPICGVRLTNNSVDKEAKGRGKSTSLWSYFRTVKSSMELLFGGSLQSHVNIEIFNLQ